MATYQETRVSDEYVAYGVYGNQVYGPYTQEALEMRENSGVNYADRIEYPQQGETLEDLYKRLTSL